MKLKTLFFLAFLVLFHTSCNQNYGNKLESEELDMYYVNSKDEELAKAIAIYWKEKGLLGQKKQFLRLSNEKKVPVLQLVFTNKSDMSTLSFDERKLLFDLQDSLRTLNGASNLEIALCDNNFNILYNINQ